MRIKLLLLPVLIIIAIIGYQLLNQNKNYNFKTDPKPSYENKNSPSKIIMTVGKENIYQKDYDTEILNHPQRNDANIRTILQEKLINDSIILQSGSKNNFIGLNQTFYNNPDKNYHLRIQKIDDLINNIENQKSTIEATVISIWFYNNNWIGPLGYEKGKDLAFRKITQIHNRVKNKEITLDQAGELIKNDNSLAQIDLAYQNNAISHVKTNYDGQISMSNEFDAILRKLKPEEVSQVYLAHDVDYKTGQRKEAVFMFGAITKRVLNQNLASFEDWLNKNKTEYEITYY